MSKDSWNGYLQDDFHKAWWTRSTAMLSHEVQLPTGSFYEPLHVWCMKCLKCSCTISSLLPEFFFGVLPYRTFEHQMDFGAKTDVLVSPDELKLFHLLPVLSLSLRLTWWNQGTWRFSLFPILSLSDFRVDALGTSSVQATTITGKTADAFVKLSA